MAIVETRRRRPLLVDELTGEVVEEVHVCARARHGRVVALGHERGVAVVEHERLVELTVGGPVAVHDEPVARIGTEVVGLLQIRRPVFAVMAVWRPPGPHASGHVHLVKDQSFGVDRWRHDVVDLAMRCSPAAHFTLHLIWSDEPRRVQTRRRSRTDREFESVLTSDDLDVVARRDVGDRWGFFEHAAAAQLEPLVTGHHDGRAGQRHDRRLLISAPIGVGGVRVEADDRETEKPPRGTRGSDIEANAVAA